MEILAKHCQAKSSAQKVRLTVNLVKGKKVFEAINILTFCKKKAAFLVKKVLCSAISNATHNFGIDSKDLFVKNIFVDEGPMMKRMLPRAKGRSDRILKRTSHITIIVASK